MATRKFHHSVVQYDRKRVVYESNDGVFFQGVEFQPSSEYVRLPKLVANSDGDVNAVTFESEEAAVEFLTRCLAKLGRKVVPA